MLLLTSTSDLITVITDAVAAVKCYAAWMDNLNNVITPGRTNTASIVTATTTTIVASPAASTQRNVKHINIRNDHASVTVNVIVNHTDGTNVEPLWRGNLLAGESVILNAEGTWTLYDANGAVKAPNTKLRAKKYVSADSIHSTAATFADVTDLQVALLSGHKYRVIIGLIHTNNASTTGSQFGYNIGAAPTVARFGEWGALVNAVTGPTISLGSATARDTAIVAQVNGQTAEGLTIIMGFIQPSADGTFSVRATSEVTVASGLVVKQGSWLDIEEVDN